MKKRGILYITLAILLVLIGSVKADRNKLTNEDILIKAFKKTDSNFKSFNINYRGVLSSKFTNIEDLRQTTEDISKSIGLIKINSEEIEETNMNQVTTYAQDDSERNITIVAYSFFDEQSQKGETTIFVDISETNKYEELDEMISKLSHTLKKYDTNVEITSCIVGTFEGKLESDYKMGKIEQIVNLTKGKLVESLIDPSITSVSLYSEYIDRYIFSGDKKMNLNISMRYNEYENKTYMLIGTPIITTGY